MMFVTAISLNKMQSRNASILQRKRYDNLCAAIEETRQIRHDIRHHWLQLASIGRKWRSGKIKEVIFPVQTAKCQALILHFCDNQAVDSVLGYYSGLCKTGGGPFLPKSIFRSSCQQMMDVCLVLSNLLENAGALSLKTERSRRKITV